MPRSIATASMAEAAIRTRVKLPCMMAGNNRQRLLMQVRALKDAENSVARQGVKSRCHIEERNAKVPPLPFRLLKLTSIRTSITARRVKLCLNHPSWLEKPFWLGLRRWPFAQARSRDSISAAIASKILYVQDAKVMGLQLDTYVIKLCSFLGIRIGDPSRHEGCSMACWQQLDVKNRSAWLKVTAGGQSRRQSPGRERCPIDRVERTPPQLR